jgi:hypothetical protein
MKSKSPNDREGSCSSPNISCVGASWMSSVLFSSRVDADSFSLCMGVKDEQIKMETLANWKKNLPESEVRFLLLELRLLHIVSSHDVSSLSQLW